MLYLNSFLYLKNDPVRPRVPLDSGVGTMRESTASGDEDGEDDDEEEDLGC